MLTPEQVQQARQKYGITPVAPPTQNTAPSTDRLSELQAAWNASKTFPEGREGRLDKIQHDLEQTQKKSSGTQFGQTFGQGVAQGAMHTVKGVSDIGQKVARTITKPIIGDAADETPTQSKLQSDAKEFLRPKTPAAQAGFTTEQIAEFFLPAAKAAQAEKAVSLLSQGIKGAPVLAAGARIFGKAAVQGVAAGGVTLAQTGGDVKQAAKTAATAGVIRGAMGVVGETARAFRLPERIYQTVFKSAKSDMLNELRAGGIETLRKNDPKRYSDMVDKGIIQMTNKGEPYLNNTLAEEALDRGLKGSLKNMADTVVHQALDSEDQARAIAKGYKGTVNLPEKQFQTVLKGIAQEWDDVGFNEVSNEADDLASKLAQTKGKLTAEDALTLRRFLDRVRIASSYDKPVTKLSLSQANLKTLADTARDRINAVPGMQDVMDNYSFAIDALDDLAKEASRRGNSQVISLIDSIFIGGGFAGGNPAAIIPIGVLRRILLSPWGATELGTLLSKGNLSAPSSALLETGSSALQSSQTTP